MNWMYILRIPQREEDKSGSSDITQNIRGMLQRLRKQSRPTSWFINDGFFCFMTIQITGRLVVAINIVDIMPSQVRSGSDRGSTSGTINVNIGIDLL